MFVAFTLLLIFTLEWAFSFDLGEYLKKSKKLQSPISSLLGALPGCGGAIVVVTQYTKGHISYSSSKTDQQSRDGFGTVWEAQGRKISILQDHDLCAIVISSWASDCKHNCELI